MDEDSYSVRGIGECIPPRLNSENNGTQENISGYPPNNRGILLKMFGSITQGVNPTHCVVCNGAK